MKQLQHTNRHYIAFTLLSIYSAITFGQTKLITPSLVDFDAYEKLVSEVKEHRKTRMLNAEEFANTSKEEKVIILDTRSDSMYRAVHIKGAIHLNFSDFTQDNLAKIIPSRDYKILIYCNNNFNNDLPNEMAFNGEKVNDFRPYFVTKMARPMQENIPPFLVDPKSKKKSKTKRGVKQITKPKEQTTMSSQFIEPSLNAKPITLALNIPTYINLYGYGYRNIYELSELVNTTNTKLKFEGTAVSKLKSN